jgi:hypothetical protein
LIQLYRARRRSVRFRSVEVRSAHGGRRQRRRWLPLIPASTGRRDGPPREPLATSGTARQRRQRVCAGFPGFLGEAVGAYCGCCRGWLLLLCAGELNGGARNGSRVEHNSQATGAANSRRAQDGDEVHDRHGSVPGEYVLPVFGYLVRAEGFPVQAEDAARPPPLVLVTRNSGEGSTLSASNRMELVDDVSAAPGRRHHIRLARH